METPNPLKGFLYPSSRVSRCPYFHKCIASSKCQMYDRHKTICNLCESRPRHHYQLGGYTPEGTWHPDLQEAMRAIMEIKHSALSNGDTELKSINGADITRKYERARKATDMMAHYTQLSGLTMNEQIMHTMTSHQEAGHLLGTF